jgi:hypothetical protein
MTDATQSTLHEKSVHFLVQRIDDTAGAAHEDECFWMDLSVFLDEEGKTDAVAEREEMRQRFGEKNIRLIQRDVLVIQTTVE